MTEIRLRNVEPWIVDVLREIARENHQSMENEIKSALLHLASDHKTKLLSKLRKKRKSAGMHTDSAPSIRQERELRW